MICFNCGYNLPSDYVGECRLCGMKFHVKCPSCSAPNPLMARFCFNCGTRIANPGAENSAQNYNKLAETRKNVAVMFADVSGFTALSEKMDPEEVRELINDCFHCITKPVYELEGTIDKFIGDCVMILFGARYPHGDDPRRAVLCALNMQDMIKEFSRERLSSKGITLSLSIGINYGLVVTGSVGNYFDKDYTVMGDTVNTAQRLQANAEKGTILVSESVYLKTKDSFHYTEPRGITVKNKDGVVKCYTPVGYKAESVYDDMFLIGRQKELDFLISTCSEVEDTLCVSVVGEAGIGKTSLVRELLSKLGGDIKKVWIDCNPIYQRRVYHTISNILAAILNMDPDDGKQIKQDRLSSYVAYILDGYDQEEVKRNCNFLSLVMNLDRDVEFQSILNSMEYEDIQREILNQLSVFFKNLCLKDRYVFIVDDIQWADSSSMSLLNNLIKSLSGVPSLFIFTTRYILDELNPIEREIRTLKLDKLDKDAVSSLACRLLNCQGIDRALLDLIIKYTDGNPLYIKEFVMAVQKQDTFVVRDGTAYMDELGAISIPDTIENLIMANLFDMDEAVATFLQTASVVGKEFNLSWVMNLLDKRVDEADLLGMPLKLNVVSLKSIRTASGNIEKVYRFNQDTVREVIYDSMLNKTKRELHRRLGELIEQRYSKDIDNYYEVLCVHFLAAGINKKAEMYYYRTAVKSKNDFNLGYSLECYDKFLEIASSHQGYETDSRVTNALIDKGNIYTTMGDYDNAMECFESALKTAVLSEDIFSIKIAISNVCKEKGMYNEALSIINEIQPKLRRNSGLYGRLLQLKCSILSIMGDSKALELAEQSEEILSRVKDYDSLSETMSQAGVIYFMRGDVDNSLFYLNKAYRYAGEVNNLRTMARVSINLGIIYHASGMVSKAFEYLNKSIEVSKKISNIQSYVSGSINLGILYMEKGLFNRAESLFQEAIDISRGMSSVYQLCVVLTNQGELMYERGDYQGALEYHKESVAVARQHDLPVEEAFNYIGMARISLKLKDYQAVPELLEKAGRIFTEAQEMASMSDYYRYISIYQLVNNRMKEALEYCERSIAISAKVKNDMKRLRALRLKGNILVLQGYADKASELYGQSIRLAEQLESDYEAAKGHYRKAMALRSLNRNEEADIEFQYAKEAIDKVDECRWTSVIEEAVRSIS